MSKAIQVSPLEGWRAYLSPLNLSPSTPCLATPQPHPSGFGDRFALSGRSTYPVQGSMVLCPSKAHLPSFYPAPPLGEAAQMGCSGDGLVVGSIHGAESLTCWPQELDMVWFESQVACGGGKELSCVKVLQPGARGWASGPQGTWLYRDPYPLTCFQSPWRGEAVAGSLWPPSCPPEPHCLWDPWWATNVGPGRETFSAWAPWGRGSSWRPTCWTTSFPRPQPSDLTGPGCELDDWLYCP